MLIQQNMSYNQKCFVTQRAYHLQFTWNQNCFNVAYNFMRLTCLYITNKHFYIEKFTLLVYQQNVSYSQESFIVQRVYHLQFTQNQKLFTLTHNLMILTCLYNTNNIFNRKVYTACLSAKCELQPRKFYSAKGISFAVYTKPRPFYCYLQFDEVD